MFSQIFDAIEEWMRELLTGRSLSPTWTRCLLDVNKRPVRLLPRLDRPLQGWNGIDIQYDPNLSDSGSCRS